MIADTSAAIAENDRRTAWLRGRAETLIHCPACGAQGQMRRVGGGIASSRFRCHAYRYNPSTANECRFVFTLGDDKLERFR